MSTDTARPRRPFRLLVVGLCALAVRAAVLAERAAQDPLHRSPTLDAEYFDQLAREIAGGDLIGGTEPWIHPPGYAYALALVYRAMGEDYRTAWPDRDYTTPCLLGVAAGTATCLLASELGLLVAGPWAALASGLAAAAYGPLVDFDCQLMPTSPLVTLIAAMLVLLAHAERAQVSGPGPLAAYATAGLCAGLAITFRPNLLALMPVFALRAFVVHARPGFDRRSRAALAFVLLAAAAAPLVVTTARNAWVTGRPTLLVVKAGFNLYLANNPDGARTARLRPGAEFYRIYRLPADEGGIAHQADWDAFYFGKIRAYAIERPAEMAGRLAVRYATVFTGEEELRNLSVYDARAHSRVFAALVGYCGGVAFPFGVVVPLAVVGLVLGWRGRTGATGLLALFVLAYAATIAIGYTAGRYRMPMIPAMLPLAALGVREALRTRRRAALGLAVALATGLAANRPATDPPPGYAAEVVFYEAQAAARAGDVRRAAALLDRSIALHPLPYALHLRGQLALDAGRIAAAAADFERAYAADPLQWSAPYMLAFALTTSNDHRVSGAALGRAVPLLRRAAALDRTVAEPLVLLGDLAAVNPLVGEPRALYREALMRAPGDPGAGGRLVRMWASALGETSR